MIYEHLFTRSCKIVKAGLVGCGDFGTAIVAQGRAVPRMELRIIAELVPERAVQAYKLSGAADDDIIVCDTAAQACEAYAAGKCVVVGDADLLAEIPLDVIVSCTRSPESGARAAKAAIGAGRHVVMVDKEADSVVGPLLKLMADKAGVVYTTDDGDEPGLLMGLAGWARSIGMEVLAGGNTHEAMFDPERRTLTGRGRTLHLTGEQMRLMERVTPDNLRGVIEARREMTRDFRIDEECGDPFCHLAIASNGTGLLPDRPQPARPLVYWDELPSVLAPRGMGGIIDNVAGAVDIPTIIRREGDPPYGGSVYIVIRSPNAYAMQKMKSKGLITNFDATAGVLYRPYHLCGAETAMSILCAGLAGMPTGSAGPRQNVDIICSARRAMKKGEIVGPRGDSGWNRDFCCSLARGIRLSDVAPIPFYMLEGNRFSQDVPEGAVITAGMVEQPEGSVLWALRREQDELTNI